MRTLWVCNVAGGPFQYTGTKPGSTPLGLEDVIYGPRVLCLSGLDANAKSALTRNEPSMLHRAIMT
jgi:hypothetical protein